MIMVERSPELEEFAREGRRRFETGDQAWFEQTTACGEVSSFGTAPDEQSRGREAVLALTMEQVQEMNAAAGLTIAAERRAGTIVSARQLADAYGVTDTDGSRPDCWGYLAAYGWERDDGHGIEQFR